MPVAARDLLLWYRCVKLLINQHSVSKEMAEKIGAGKVFLGPCEGHREKEAKLPIIFVGFLTLGTVSSA